MSTVLVTGGAGFIGTHVVHALSADPGRSVVVLDALTYAGNLAGIEPLIDRHKSNLYAAISVTLNVFQKCSRVSMSNKLSTSRPNLTSTAPSKAQAPSCKPT